MRLQQALNLVSTFPHEIESVYTIWYIYEQEYPLRGAIRNSNSNSTSHCNFKEIVCDRVASKGPHSERVPRTEDCARGISRRSPSILEFKILNEFRLRVFSSAE